MSPPSGNQAALPLDGILVVAIEHAVAAPLATRHLADQGARVIKLERPLVGDFARHYDELVEGLSGYFVWLNRNKESVSCDLKEPADREFVERLLAQADVFVQNLAPGAAARLGLSARQVADRHDRVVACDLSGYGEGGPYSDRKAYDLLIQSETGLVSITGNSDSAAKAGISVADISGGMYALSAVLSGLYERERNGRGTALEVSLFDGLAEWMSQPMYAASYGEPLPRTGADHASIAPYGPIICSDGRELVIAVQNDREWHAFCDGVLRRPELSGDHRFATNWQRVRNRKELGGEIDRLAAELSGAEMIDRLESSRIAYAIVREPGELRDHPQLVARDRWRTVGTPGGEVAALLPPVNLLGREPRMDPVPAVGEHTAAVWEWLEEVELGAAPAPD